MVICVYCEVLSFTSMIMTSIFLACNPILHNPTQSTVWGLQKQNKTRKESVITSYHPFFYLAASSFISNILGSFCLTALLTVFLVSTISSVTALRVGVRREIGERKESFYSHCYLLYSKQEVMLKVEIMLLATREQVNVMLVTFCSSVR
jgi:hypothetical protein